MPKSGHECHFGLLCIQNLIPTASLWTVAVLMGRDLNFSPLSVPDNWRKKPKTCHD